MTASLPFGFFLWLQFLTQQTCSPGTPCSSFGPQASGCLSGGSAKGRSGSVSVCVFPIAFTLMKSLYVACRACVCVSAREQWRKGCETERFCGLGFRVPQRAASAARLVSRGAQLRDEVLLEYPSGDSSVLTPAPSHLGLSSL